MYTEGLSLTSESNIGTWRVWLESRHAAAHESWGRKLAKACKSEVLGCGYIKQQLWQEWRGEVDFGRGQGESGPSRKVIGRPRQASPSSVTPYHSVAKSCCWEGEGGVWALSVRYVPRILAKAGKRHGWRHWDHDVRKPITNVYSITVFSVVF